MRDTKALQAARGTEENPYARRFGFPKYNQYITVLDEPRLFAQLPEFAAWDKTRHQAAAEDYLAVYLADEATYNGLLDRYRTLYGTAGSYISGGFYDTWPDYTREPCRLFARRLTDFAGRSLAHWIAAGHRGATWSVLRDQSRDQAARLGFTARARAVLGAK